MSDTGSGRTDEHASAAPWPGRAGGATDGQASHGAAHEIPHSPLPHPPRGTDQGRAQGHGQGAQGHGQGYGQGHSQGQHGAGEQGQGTSPPPAAATGAVPAGGPAPTAGSAPTGGWTPPMDDPLFGPLPAYTPSAYPYQTRPAYPAYPTSYPTPYPTSYPTSYSASPYSASPLSSPTTGSPLSPAAGSSTTGSPTTGPYLSPTTGATPAAGTPSPASPATSPSAAPSAAEAPTASRLIGAAASPGSATAAGTAMRAAPETTTSPDPLSAPQSTDEGSQDADEDGPDGSQPTGREEPADGRTAPRGRFNLDALGERLDARRAGASRFSLGRRTAAAAGGEDTDADNTDTDNSDTDKSDTEDSEDSLDETRYPAELDEDIRDQRPPLSFATKMRRVLAAVGAAVAVVTLRGNDEQAAPPPEAPNVPTFDPSIINSSRTDVSPVSEGEFFSEERVSIQGRAYRRLATRTDDGCPELTGELAGALEGTRCLQLVRALYVSEPVGEERQVLAGLAVFALDEQETAVNAATIANEGRGGVTPLPIPEGAIEGAQITGPAGDNSWRAAVNRGRYMILTQLAYVDGTQGAADDPPLRNAISDLSLVATDPLADRMMVTTRPSASPTA